MDDNLTLLTRANAKEIVAAFKFDSLGRFQPLAEWLASFPARRLSRQIFLFDDLVGRHRLAAAGRYILDEFTSSTHIEGQQHVPRCGPLLAVANHPGMVDAMAIWVALEQRPDLPLTEREVAFARDFPGRVGRFTDGKREIIIRWVNAPTRRLHAAADCFRGGGYSTTPLPARRSATGAAMGCFRASHRGDDLMICEVIGDERGETWPDVSAWYWHAMFGSSPAPWWSFVIADRS